MRSHFIVQSLGGLYIILKILTKEMFKEINKNELQSIMLKDSITDKYQLY